MILTKDEIVSQKILVRGAPEFMKIFDSLDKKGDRYKEIDSALELLKRDYTVGDKIAKNRWPEIYIKKYGINTLFRFKLSQGWRMIYTISGTKEEKICTILEALDHTQYEKRFGY